MRQSQGKKPGRQPALGKKSDKTLVKMPLALLKVLGPFHGVFNFSTAGIGPFHCQKAVKPPIFILFPPSLWKTRWKVLITACIVRQAGNRAAEAGSFTAKAVYTAFFYVITTPPACGIKIPSGSRER